jgi:hypothetical protein
MQMSLAATKPSTRLKWQSDPEAVKGLSMQKLSVDSSNPDFDSKVISLRYYCLNTLFYEPLSYYVCCHA